MGSHALKHEPPDAYNLALTENLHPAGWVNPTPADRYNMVVIGAGTAGLVTAAGGSAKRTPAGWAFTAVGFVATVAVAVYATRIGARALREKT